MPTFERLSPSFIKHFLGRIKPPRNFFPENVAESDGVLSVLKPINSEPITQDKLIDEFYHKGILL